MCGIGAALLNAPIVVATSSITTTTNNSNHHDEIKSDHKTDSSLTPSSSGCSSHIVDEWCSRLVHTLRPRGPDVQRSIPIPLSSKTHLVLSASVLHLRVCI
jgi:hypothetical protein